MGKEKKNTFKKFTTKVKKSMKRLKYLDKTQASYFVVTSFIAAFFLFTGVTYSYFTFSKHMNAATITIAKLEYDLDSETVDFKNDTVTVLAHETKIIDLKLSSFNAERTRYALNYSSKNKNIKVYYSENLKNNMSGIIGAKGSLIDMRVVIVNGSDVDSEVVFTLDGGYLKNTLKTNITEGYFEQDLTVRTVLYDEDFLNATQGLVLPDKEEYSFYKVECTNGVTGSFDEDSWSLKRNDETKQTSCDVYFKKSKEELEIYYAIRGTNETYSITETRPDVNGLYKYTGSTCSNKATYTFDEATYEFNVTSYQKNTLCVANFEIDEELEVQNRMSITFDANGGKLKETSKSVYVGGTYGRLTRPTYDGHLFLGWFTDPVGGIEVTSTTQVEPSSSTKLYAHYEAMPNVDVTIRTLNLDKNALISAVDDYGTSYYFKKDTSANYIKFAGMYFRIVRINGDGTLRVMYEGKKLEDDNHLAIESSKWNEEAGDVKYAGLTYGNTEAQESTSLEEVIGFENKSKALNNLEKWYETNILNRGYSNAVADRVFCSDRTLLSEESLGYGANTTIYGMSSRLEAPSFVCSSKDFAYTTKDDERGNTSLKYPVGLITADEVVAIGKTIGETNYLSIGSSYWTITPYGFEDAAKVFIVDGSGILSREDVTSSLGMRPVINLSFNYVTSLKGDGTKENVYRSLD